MRALQGVHEALGFAKLRDGRVAISGCGAGCFTLERRCEEDRADNVTMRLTADDLDAWWRHVQDLDLPAALLLLLLRQARGPTRGGTLWRFQWL